MDRATATRLKHILKAVFVKKFSSQCHIPRSAALHNRIGKDSWDDFIDHQTLDRMAEWRRSPTAISTPNWQSRVMARRYALYYSPPTESPLGRFGAAWLGRTIEGQNLSAPTLEGIREPAWKATTSEARRYGFHATLKPPFRLAPEATEEALIEAMESFCRATPAVPLGTLSVQQLSGFFALRPEADEPVSALAQACVQAFDDFRAPSTAEEIARRRPDALSNRQKNLLDRWGYPYVMEEFRFHMTLTGHLTDPEAAVFRKTLETRYAPLVDQAVTINDICLFRQETPEDNFVLVGHYALSGR